MLKTLIAFSLALTAVLPATLLAADESGWNPESEESALRFLEESRQAVSQMRRFDVECLRSDVDGVDRTEHRLRIRAYCEGSVGYLVQHRPVDNAWMISRHVCREHSETWLRANGVWTEIDEEQRNYHVETIRRQDFFADLMLDMPHRVVPPWFEPTIEMVHLRLRYRIASAKSTPAEFYIELVPREPVPPWRVWDDERLEAPHRLWIDRQTHLPKKWWIKTPRREQETTFTYTRFDVDPPPRELRVPLAGYREFRNSSIPGEEFLTP
jgi:hypothetical protein